MKYWEHVKSDVRHADKWVKDGMMCLINPAAIMIAPEKDCEDYYDKYDMMSFNIFFYALIGITNGTVQGREIVSKHFDREEALWMLGWYGLIPNKENESALKEAIDEACGKMQRETK